MLLDSLRSSGVINIEDNSKTIFSPTGFTAIDLLGGSLERTKDFIPYLNTGISNRFYMKTGQSGQGKTTLAIQSCCYGVDWWNKRYPQEPSDFIMIDSEDNTTVDRIISISDWSYDYFMKHCILKKDVNLTDIYNFLLKLIDTKQKNKDHYYVETDILNIDGRPLKAWATTYVLIDSIAAIKNTAGLENVDRDKSGELKSEEISGNIDAMREAKLNTDFIIKMKPLCFKYGIYLGLINHITQEQKMSMFDIPKRYLISLKPGEKLRGGLEPIYQAFGIDRLYMKERLDERNPIYGDNIFGFIAEFTYLKSKNKGENIPYRMVIDKSKGYMPELSDFEYLYSVDYGIGGSPASMYMEILPEIKFTRKTLYEKCRNNGELARAIEFTARYHIIYKLIMGRMGNPDIRLFSDLPYEERIKYIYQYTKGYIGYESVGMSIEGFNTLESIKSRPDNPFKYDLSNSYINIATMSLLQKTEDCGPYTVPVSIHDFITPHSLESGGNGVLIDKEFVRVK